MNHPKFAWSNRPKFFAEMQLIFSFFILLLPSAKTTFFSGYRQRGHLLSCKRYYAFLICCSLSHFSLSHRVSRPLTRQIIEITTSSMLLLSIVCYVSLSAICPPVIKSFLKPLCASIVLIRSTMDNSNIHFIK